MLQDGILLLDDSVISNLQIQYGSSLPSSGNNLGELFYKTGVSAGLYIYNGSSYDPVGSSSGNIDASQVTSGTFADARIAQSNVTQYQAALTILETQITDGSLLARNAGNETITGTWSFNNAVTGVSPSTANQLATKQYVDNVATGLDVKNSVRAATTANITLSGPQTIDGVSVVAADRVLVKNQTTGSQNGIYIVAAGAWTRSSDADNSPSTGEVTSGMFTFVTSGTVNGNTGFVLTTDDPITLGSTALVFTQFSAATSGVNSIIAGTNISVSSSTGNVTINTTGATLASTQVGFGSAGNLLSGSAKFTWIDGSNTLFIGSATTGAATTVLQGTTGALGTPPNFLIKGAQGAGTQTGGALTLAAGRSTTEGSGGGNSGPSLFLEGGTAGGGVGSGGSIFFSTSPDFTSSMTERFRITHQGAWGLSGANYGTSGQVLTSSGSSTAPSWTTLSTAAAAGTLTGTTLAANVVTSSLTSLGTLSSITITSSATVGTNNSTFTVTTPATSIGGQVGGAITIQGGQQNNTSSAGGNVALIGGSGAALNTTGGNASLTGGSGIFGGNAVLSGGTGTTNGGDIVFSTAPTTSLVERLRISESGEWLLAGSAGTGTYVLTSNGAGAAPTWQASSGGGSAAAGTLTGTTLASNVVNSSLTTLGTLSALAVTGTTTQTGALNLGGSSSPLQVQGSAGTSGQVLTSAGTGATPTWTTFSATFTGGTVSGATTFQDNVTMSGTTKRFFLNNAASFPARTLFVSSTTNSFTSVGIIPNGTSTLADTTWAWGNAAGVGNSGDFSTNFSYGSVQLDGSVPSFKIQTAAAGTGVLLPISFIINGSEKFRIGTGGDLLIAGTTPGTSGQVLTSGGAGAAPTWASPGTASTLANAVTHGTVVNTALSITGLTSTSASANTAPMSIVAPSTAQAVAGNNLILTGGANTVGNNSAGAGGAVLITGGTPGASGTGNGGAVTISAGASGALGAAAGAGGTLTLNGGAGLGSGASSGGKVIITGANGTATGGNVEITSGGGNSAGNSGNIYFYTTVVATKTERLRIDPTGAWLIATVAGTAGQVLTSNGSGVVSWGGAGVLANATILGTSAAALSITGFAGTSSTAPVTISAGSSASGGGNAIALVGGASTGGAAGSATVRAGDTTDANNGGNLVLRSGSSASTGSAGTVLVHADNSGTGVGGQVTIRGGDTGGNGVTGGLLVLRGGNSNNGTTSGTGGNVQIAAGTTNAVGAPGIIFFQTGSAAGVALAERMRVNTTSVSVGTTANGSTNTQLVLDNGGLELRNTSVGVAVAGTVGALQVGALFATAITSTTDAFVTMAVGTAPLITSTTVNTTGTVVIAARNVASAGIALATQNTARMLVNYTGRIDKLSGWSDKKNAPAFSATPTIDLSLGNSYAVTLTANITAIAFSNVPAAGQVFTLTYFLTQDGTGSRTVVWPTSFKWQGGATPVLTTTAGKTDIFQAVTHDGGVTWYASIVGLSF